MFSRVSECDIPFFFNTLRRYPSLGALVRFVQLDDESAGETTAFLQHLDLLPNVKRLYNLIWAIESDKKPQPPRRDRRPCLTGLQLSALDPEFYFATLGEYFDLAGLTALAVKCAPTSFGYDGWSDVSLFEEMPSSLVSLAVEDLYEDSLPFLLDVVKRFTVLEELRLSLNEVNVAEVNLLAVLPSLQLLTVQHGFNLAGLLVGLGEGHCALVKLSIVATASEDDVFDDWDDEQTTDVEEEHELYRFAIAVASARSSGLLPSLRHIRIDRAEEAIDWSRRADMPGLQAMARMLCDVGLVVEDARGQIWQHGW